MRDPKAPGRTITDFDRIEDGILWEEKTAADAMNHQKWIDKHIFKKEDAYLEGRQIAPGYENAPIDFRFSLGGKSADPAFKSAVENAVDRLRSTHPNVNFRLEWE